jgi:hypothetical protein
MRHEVIDGVRYEFHNSQRGCHDCYRPLVKCDECCMERYCETCKRCELECYHQKKLEAAQ